MTFDKAYCKELDANITAYKARREFFAQNNINLKYNFFCPDENCNVEMTGFNIYAIGMIKQRVHFKTKKNCRHSENCSIVAENIHHENTFIARDGRAEGNGKKFSQYPDEFILKRSKIDRNVNNSICCIDDEFDIEPRSKKQSSYENTTKLSAHKTSYLENVVDSYEDMKTDKEKKVKYIKLGIQKRSYKNTFKDIKYFEDGENFIFNGEIEPVKQYGNNYAIKFKDRAWYQGKPYQVSIYITRELITSYRLSRLFQESISKLSKLEKKYNLLDATS